MAQQRNVDPEVAIWRAKKAANARWRKAGARKRGSESAKRAMRKRWEREVDPDGTLPEDVRERLAQQAMLAHMQKLAVDRQVKQARQRAERDRDQNDTATVATGEQHDAPEKGSGAATERMP
jgi:hypothetical protein